MASSGLLYRVAVVRTDVSEERSYSIIRVTRIDELVCQSFSFNLFNFVNVSYHAQIKGSF
jgi:hypothetical protein